MENANLFTPKITAEYIAALCEVEKLAWSSPGENIEANPEKIRQRLESFSQGVTLALVGEKAAGSQYSFLFNWDGNLEKLTTWDEMTSEGWTNKVHNAEGNTGFLVGVGVVPEFRGQLFETNVCAGKHKISESLISYTLEKLFAGNVGSVVACARIPLYHTWPDLTVAEYCKLRREDGKLYDPVLRFHERLHAKLIKPVAYAMEDAESMNGGCFVQYQPMISRL